MMMLRGALPNVPAAGARNAAVLKASVPGPVYSTLMKLENALNFFTDCDTTPYRDIQGDIDGNIGSSSPPWSTCPSGAASPSAATRLVSWPR